MKNEITLSLPDTAQERVTAVVRPDEGMTLRSLRHGSVEAICQSRTSEYDACRKGYGPLIGPHFNQRLRLPDIASARQATWQHARALKQMGIADCWQHGVGRYAAWDYTSDATTIRATLQGDHLFDGIPLHEIQGGDFEMSLEMRVSVNALHLHYTANADFPPLIGLHYYFNLPDDQGNVRAPITGIMQPQEGGLPIPSDWLDDSGYRLELGLQRALDHIFPLRPGPIELETKTHRVWIIPEEGVEALVVFHPGNNGWACVEPLSAANPRQLAGHQAAVKLAIMIEPKEHNA